ncbi:hypothetical protein A3C18_02600 [Candidatus Kaiserbacteria bacterium RIFCSPHIGHO2_02_FULL_54_11b]|uniref:Uncharacterized protein n=1 Tax=Candidatus Kaiserbacteria bacterium RIFCSPHIGHO2_02_FULL_54_11b TaxID=1798494 RepID=A0A1F6DRV4_9BACT|nr:MAG: hypothetical protein A3C18_02600 [Candidatus Kaiserbacteria bacterium RIFCSPHIGHO2_02_FULL_54_11b]
MIFIGLATIVFSLIILSFGTLVLVWLWSHIWHRRLQFLAFLRLSADVFKNAARNTASFFGMAERELKSDVGYSIHRLTGELKEASYTLSFRDLVRRYLFSLSDIVKRSFTKNITVDPNTTEGLNKPERDLF